MEDRYVEALAAELQSLRIRVGRLEAELAGRTDGTNETRGAETNDISVGDRIRIVNRVKRPANQPENGHWTEERERLGTVTKIVGDRIHFVTGNGTHTWRAPNNVKKI